jgi:MFS family permease
MRNKQLTLNLVFCSIMHGLNHYLLIFFKPMYPLMSDYFKLNTLAGLTTRMTIVYVGYGIANFLSGWLSRYFSKKLILFWGMLLMSLSTIGLAFIPGDQYTCFVIIAFFMGLGGGTYHPAANTLITLSFEGKPGYAIGVLSIGSAVGFIAAPLLGEYLGLKLWGFKTLFLVSGLLSCLFTLVFLLNVRETTNGEANEKAARRLVPASQEKTLQPGFWLIIVLVSIPVTLRDLINWSFYEITPFWVANGFSGHIPIGIVQAMQFLPGLLVQPLTGKLCDKLGASGVVVVALLVTGLGANLLCGSEPVILWAGLILFGIGMSSSVVAGETYMATVVPPAFRSLIYGIALSIALGVGGGLSGVSGWVVDLFGKTQITGYRVWFFITAGLAILAALTYLFIYRLSKLIRNPQKNKNIVL